MGQREALGFHLTKLRLTQCACTRPRVYAHSFALPPWEAREVVEHNQGSRVGRVAGVQKQCWAKHGSADESGRGVKTASKRRLGARQGVAGILQAGKGQPGGRGAEAVEGGPEPAE